MTQDGTNATNAIMDQEQVIKLVRTYKRAIRPLHKDAKVYLYGSYSKGTAREDSDIDVAVIVPHMEGNWFSIVPPLWTSARKVSSLIEPVIMEANEHSPLYDDVMRTGIAI